MNSSCCITYSGYNYDGAAVLELIPENGPNVAINLVGATVTQQDGFFVIIDLRNRKYKINGESIPTHADVQLAIEITHQ